MECSIQRGEEHFIFHRIAQMKNIHYLFYITSKHICCHLERSNYINIGLLENAILFRFDRAISGQRSGQRTIQRFNCTIAQYYLTMTSQFVEWSIYFISREPASSNQMTRICIGVI